MGYQRNKYDWCVMKKIVKGKQFTILWYVDNIKLLHVDSDILYSIISDIDIEYGKIDKMTITRVNIQKYLRMIIDFSLPGKVKLYMVGYIGNMLDNIPEDMKGESEKPASHHLFDTAEDATKISRTDAYILHHFVAHILYL